MPDYHLDVKVSLGALQAVPLCKLQRLIDMLQFSRVGASLVAEDHYPPLDFISIQPSANTRLSLAEARDAALGWFILHGLRDGIEAVSMSLEDSRRVADIYRLAAKGQVTGAEFNAVPAENKRFHRLGLPDKVRFLNDTYGLASDFDSHLLSLNVARNCVVHRDGLVTPLDLNIDNQLSVTFLRVGLAAVSPNGESSPITGPQVVEAGWTIQASIGPTTRTFAVGERIQLEYDDLLGAFFSMQQYVNHLAAGLQAFGESLGLKFPDPKPAA